MWAAFREGEFGEQAKLYVGWLMVVEDCPKSAAPVGESSAHFPIFPDFRDASYIQRYNALCRKLMQKQLYTLACILTSPRTAVTTGEYAELPEMMGLRTFVTEFAGHVAAEASRT